MLEKAQNKLDYTLALATVSDGGKDYGCIINSLHQVTSSFPAKFSVALNKENETTKHVLAAGKLTVTLLGADCPEKIVNDFGYRSGRAVDKFAGYDVKRDGAEQPYITDGMVGRISLNVVSQVEVDNFVLLVCALASQEVFSEGGVLTLKAFTDRGKDVPPAASVYRTVEIKGYRCTICGYVYEGESLPADFVCPICRATADKFEEIQ